MMTSAEPSTPRRSQRLKFKTPSTPKSTSDLFKDVLIEDRARLTSLSSSAAREPDSANQGSFFDEDIDRLSFMHAPLLTMKYCLKFFVVEFAALKKISRRHVSLAIAFGLFLLVPTISKAIPGAHLDFIVAFEEQFFWYARWFILGVLSSIGLGTGAHTFLLFLGPMIAETTTAAYTCMSLDFDLFGPQSFLCQDKIRVDNAVSLINIFRKVFMASFFWGAGTAFGELPPYFVARASAKAGKMTGDLKEMKGLLKKHWKERSLSENLQIFMYYTVEYAGFPGILVAASIPNPLFDLAGITCGYFLVPFYKFFVATFIGKAIIKASLQAFFVIFLFSKQNMNWIISNIKAYWWQGGTFMEQYLAKQKAQFLDKTPIVEESFNVVSFCWNAFIAAMVAFFVLSMLQSFAKVQARRETKKHT